MCGLAGILLGVPRGVPREQLVRMGSAIRHRGPDGFGLYLGRRVGLAHVRLSIIDLAGGAQPLTNEVGDVIVAYNGEIYNYRALRAELLALGHRFRTASDTEVLVHAWESWGRAMLPRLEGQFAFALYDRRTERLVLARDRFGVRPLFYAQHRGDLYFGSEVKALFASGALPREADPVGVDQALLLWGPRAPRTPFRGVRQVEPGSWLEWHAGSLTGGRYWQPDFPEAAAAPADAVEQLDALLRASVRDRLVADVPVGAYLSGGLDSSVICRLANEAAHGGLRTFSIAFEDPRFDERPHQELVARALGTRHTALTIGNRAIAEAFPAAVWHAETPLMRTAPVPLYHLARLTREHGITVVLTGEGADELFLGYDLFKETLVRHFCLRQPGSSVRPRLFERLYGYLGGAAGGEFWRQAFLEAGPIDDPLFSHLPRFAASGAVRAFYSPAFRAAVESADPLVELRATLPAGFTGWSAMNRAAWLELETLLAGYLLAAQGDRMSLAFGVEGRYPFLDHRLFAFAAALPESAKLRGLRDKRLLRAWARTMLPAAAAERPKQPYRSPDAQAFFAPGAPGWIDEALSPEALATVGLFAPAAVAGLVRRGRAGRITGAREGQALVGIISTQLWHQAFLRDAEIGVVLAVPDTVLDESRLVGQGAA
ncbi:MAG: asparagine synthase (glutamine-hydrolyzing) [Gemmatimonadetes bacterium]|nr:asparagine synthase (glutamine-hydrolyzing) [Gemmatimonadota bacterium]